MRGPSVAVVGTGEGKTELARGVKGVGGEVVWETVYAGPGRECGIGAPESVGSVETMEWKRALTVGRAAVLVPAS